MICKNCGSELKEGARFCAKCGAAQPAPDIWQVGAPGMSAAAAQAPAASQKKRERKSGIVVSSVGGRLLAVAGGFILFSLPFLFFTSDFYQCKRNMKQAQSCFEEGEYEDALEYYEAALEIDDSLTEAYLQSADIYVEENQYENAIPLLEKGIEKSQNQEEEQLLSDKLTEVYQLESDYYGKAAETFMTQVFSEAVNENELKGQYPKFMNETIEEVCSVQQAVMQEANADFAEEFAGLDLWDYMEISGETVSKERIEQENLKEYQDVIIGFADGDEEIEVQAGYQITGKIKMELTKEWQAVMIVGLKQEMGREPTEEEIEEVSEEEVEYECVVLKCNGKTGVWKIDGDYIWNVTIEGM